mgnify:FL=1
MARATFYKSMFSIGVFSPNDIRELEDQNPIGPAGDEYFVQANNLRPITQVVNPAFNRPIPPNNPPGQQPPPDQGTDPEQQRRAPRGSNGHAKHIAKDLLPPPRTVRNILRDEKGLITQIIDEPMLQEETHDN